MNRKKTVFFAGITLIFGIFIWLRWTVIWLWPLMKKIQIYVGDDLFYYLNIAHNIAGGYGVSFDKITTTNGFHPLYMLILAGFYKFLPFFEKYDINLTLTFATCVQMATAFVLFRILRTLSLSLSGCFIALTVFLLHPINFFAHLSGVETPVALLFISLGVLFYITARKSGFISINTLMLSGLMFGLAFMSRTDSCFIIAGIGLDFFVFYLIKQQRPIQERLRTAILFVIPIALPALPWFIWNAARYGTIAQDSMKAIKFWSYHYINANGAVQPLTHSVGELLQWIFAAFSLIFFARSEWYFLVLLIALAGAIFVEIKLRKKPDQLTPALLFPAGMTIILLLFYLCVLRHWQYWYVLTGLFFFSIFHGVLFDMLGDLISKKIVCTIFCAAVAIGFALFAHYHYCNLVNEAGFYDWQRAFLKASLHARKYVPADARIGSFNSGIAGRFSKRTVINLDGVVNHEVLPYLKAGRIMDYIKHRNITYILDSEKFTDIFKNHTARVLYQGTGQSDDTISLIELKPDSSSK